MPAGLLAVLSLKLMLEELINLKLLTAMFPVDFMIIRLKPGPDLSFPGSKKAELRLRRRSAA